MITSSTCPVQTPRACLATPGEIVVVNEGRLSAVLSDFARTMATDVPIQSILDHLVERIVEILPITSAGVTLISAGVAPRYVAASDAAALRFERLQTDIEQGPCISAFETGAAVTVPDLSLDDRFPQFAPAALDAGLAAVFTFPLRHGEGRLGALDLYRDVVGPLDAHDMGAAQTLADVAAAYLLNARAREQARETSDHLRHNALHDPLTGLGNRALLQQRLEHAAGRALGSGASTAVLLAGLDRFKRVNVTHGDAVGDELLRAVARRLAGLVRPGDTLARVAGDEFVFLCESVHAQDVEGLAQRVDNAFAVPFAVSGTELRITASVGVAVAGPGEDVSSRLVTTADGAMFQAKRRGGATHLVIDLRAALERDERDRLEGDLQLALDGDQLEVAYQPVVQVADGTVVGVEALLRWTHPRRGPVKAMQLVQVAERSRLILDVGAWVLERGCRDRQRWLLEHPNAPLDVAVNVSARQLVDRQFADTVSGVLARTGMNPGALVLEVTETTLLEDSARALTVLNDLRDLGIRLALDDFGTGFSSLSYLRRLPIDVVKIDQSFVADIDHAATGGAIVAAVTELAHVFGLCVTAEGVETASQRDEVSAIGCDLAQGYYFAHPVPADVVGDMLCRAGGIPLHLPRVPMPVAGVEWIAEPGMVS